MSAHPRSEHWFKCAHCGYVGTEDELPDDPEHECGKDECPECHRANGITCCYPTSEAAHIGGPEARESAGDDTSTARPEGIALW